MKADESPTAEDLAAITSRGERAMSLIGESMRLYLQVLNHSW